MTLTPAQRLQAAREKAGFTSATKAAEALGIGPSTYRAHENGQNNFNFQDAERYARRFGVSAIWLVSGQEVDITTHQSEPLAGDIAQLDIFAGMGNGGLLSVETDASGKVCPEYVDGHWSFPDSVKAGIRRMKSIYALPVVGDSMAPTLPGGSVVFVDTSHRVPAPADIYAVDYGDGLMVKRVELIPQSEDVRVISDNARYSTYTLPRETVLVYGRVVAWFQWRG
jgi:phage repressor protein C with HTH and peptisase S24 domain